MNFLAQLKQSLYPKNYISFFKHSVTSSLRYFLLVSVLLASVMVLSEFVPSLTQVNKAATSFSKSHVAEDLFPQNLVVRLDNGKLSTNQSSPVVIPVPKDYVEDVPNLIVIDPTATLDSFYSYRTLVLLTKDSLVVAEKDNQIRTVSFEKFGTEKIELDRSIWNNILSKIKQYLSWGVPVFIGVALLAGIFGLLVVFSLMLLGYSLVTYFLSRLMRTGLPFKRSIQVTAYLLPLFTVVDFAMDLLGKYNLFSFPHLKMALFGLIIIKIFSHYRAEHHASVKPLRKWLLIIVGLLYLLLVSSSIHDHFTPKPAVIQNQSVISPAAPSITPSISLTPSPTVTKAISPSAKKNNCSAFSLSNGQVNVRINLKSDSGHILGKTVIRIKPSGQCPNESPLLEHWLEPSETTWTSSGINPGRYLLEAANGNYQGVVSRTVDLVKGGYELTINVP